MAPSLARPLIFGSDGWGQYLISALLLHPRLEFLGFRIEFHVLAEFEVRNRLRRPRRSAVIYTQSSDTPRYSAISGTFKNFFIGCTTYLQQLAHAAWTVRPPSARRSRCRPLATSTSRRFHRTRLVQHHNRGTIATHMARGHWSRLEPDPIGGRAGSSSIPLH